MSPRTHADAALTRRLVANLHSAAPAGAADYVEQLQRTAKEAADTEPSAQRTHALRHVARLAAGTLDDLIRADQRAHADWLVESMVSAGLPKSAVRVREVRP